jgi:hypothetical protein
MIEGLADNVRPHHAYRPGATAAHVSPCGGGSTPPQQAMLSVPAAPPLLGVAAAAGVVTAQAEYAPLSTVLPFRMPPAARSYGTRVCKTKREFVECFPYVCPEPVLVI